MKNTKKNEARRQAEEKIILAIDTSCDETAVAVSFGDRLQTNVLSSSMDFHNDWGGVVPIYARRNHIERFDAVLKRALTLAQITLDQVDAFAVTYGPGLAVALEVGIAKAKELATKYDKPLIAVNHMAGHIYANMARNRAGRLLGIDVKAEQQLFPLIALLISGGHTELVYMRSHMDFEVIGETLDDSVGEAFDKVARMLQWGYPGGPIIEELAKQGDPSKFKFSVPLHDRSDLAFSFSGLKTGVLRKVQELGTEAASMYEQNLHLETKVDSKDMLYAPSFSKKPTYTLARQDALDIAAAFQSTAAEHLRQKLARAIELHPVKNVLLGGGVVNNAHIRRSLRADLRTRGVKLFYPRDKKLLTDNAGMIAIAGYYMAESGNYVKIETLDREPRLRLGQN